VVAEVRERLVVGKRAVQRLHMEIFNLKKPEEVEGEEEYRVKISNQVRSFGKLR
jgi:hypothetical protein